MKKLQSLLEELKNRTFQISETAKGEQIQQTQRNNLKTELLQAIAEDIEEIFSYVFQSEEGVLIEIANDSIANNLKSSDGSGAITACLDIKIKNLDCNADLDNSDFTKKLQEKDEKKKIDAEKKQKKIIRDKADREKKKALKGE